MDEIKISTGLSLVVVVFVVGMLFFAVRPTRRSSSPDLPIIPVENVGTESR